MNLQAVIMAGGEGTRLRPITCTMPKPLVPIAGRPCINYCAELLARHGVQNVVTTVFYQSEKIERHLGNGDRFGLNITHSKAPKPLGTAGSVKYAAGKSRTPVLVISGDTLTDCDLTGAYEYHKKKGACATIILKRVSAPTEYGVALMADDGRITRFYEKPAQSEVFSDLANTGIYILEPHVLDLIPPEANIDFSMDLFPLLLEKHMPVYGFEMQGYWCDVGNIKQYMQAQRDVLDGKTAFDIHADCRGGIYIEDNVHISDNAQIKAPCYVSSGAEIGENAKIEAYTVIGRCAKVYAGADIKRSVIMNGAVIHENAQLRGACICPEVTIDRFSSVYEGSCIGEHTHIGQSVTVSHGASIWPDKHIADNSQITDNVVWGTGRRMEITDRGISGCCDTDVSPETALRIGAVFAQIVSKYGQIAVSGDGKRVTSMLKRAACAGIISQGVDAVILPQMPTCVFSHSVRQSGMAGGIYISTDTGDAHRANMMLCDHTGFAVTANIRRKIDRIFSSGEQKPVTHREIGIAEEMTGTVLAYEAELLRSVPIDKSLVHNMKVLLDVPAGLYAICAPMLMRLGIDTISADTEQGMNMQMRLQATGSTIGFYVPETNVDFMPAVMLANGKSTHGNALTAIFAYDAIASGRQNRFTMPVTFPDEYARLLMDKGAQLITAPEYWHAWQRAAYGDGTYLCEFFDPIAAILRTVQMHSAERFERTLDLLPETYRQEYTVPCSDFGKVLRSLHDSESGEDTEHIDGIKIHRDNGWVIVKAAGDGIEACRIICGSFKEEYANDLTSMYVDKLRAIMTDDN